MSPKPSLQEIEQAIERADPEQQKQLLKDLPRLLKISSLDIALLKIAEPSFEFWNHPDDTIYDSLHPQTKTSGYYFLESV